jgi:site-specific DNA-methyltransferase (adenine-specific)
MTITFYPDDCTIVLPVLQENSVDACVTDPPYGLNFMGKGWDDGAVAFDPETWKKVYRVLKPGAHLLAFGGTRTFHRMACAIEDAGFEIRDTVMWLYGTGFPKSLDVSKAIDKQAGAERNKVARVRFDGKSTGREGASFNACDVSMMSGPPITEAAKQWQGWGTALKPAWEPIIMARKPLIGTVAKNVLEHGVGGINIDGCRVGNTKQVPKSVSRNNQWYGNSAEMGTEGGHNPNLGRWPANLVHDGSDEVEATFMMYGNRKSCDKPSKAAAAGKIFGGSRTQGAIYPGDNGSAARFFYSAKASKADRNGSKHPTVKPIALMQYLCRLVTPPNGVVLDPFAGSGTTGRAALLEGFSAILIEREEEYIADIKRRFEEGEGCNHVSENFSTPEKIFTT